jgi:hypothetical protein
VSEKYERPLNLIAWAAREDMTGTRCFFMKQLKRYS